MKKHSKVGNRKGRPAYRTPSRIKNLIKPHSDQRKGKKQKKN